MTREDDLLRVIHKLIAEHKGCLGLYSDVQCDCAYCEAHRVVHELGEES